MAQPLPLPRELFLEPAGNGFVDSIDSTDLVYFLLNVGDGDSQVVLLPDVGKGRAILIVDVFKYEKTSKLLKALERNRILTAGDPNRRLFVVATHPHRDHIAGMAKLLDDYKDDVWEYWDSGYRHTGQDYQRLTGRVRQLAAHERQSVRHAEFQIVLPTAGMQRYLDDVAITVLAPSIRLRNRYDTYGVEANDASIVLKLEYPTHRVFHAETKEQRRTRLRKTTTLILGGDAQTYSWGTAMGDFPKMYGGQSRVADELRVTVDDAEPLSADVFKVPHHASKRGLNLELVERIDPELSLVSCKRYRSNYDFPHDVAQATLREAIQATAKKHSVRRPDWALGVHYTSDELAADGAFAREAKACSAAVTSLRAVDAVIGAKQVPADAEPSVARELNAIAAALGSHARRQAAEQVVAALDAMFQTDGDQDKRSLAQNLTATFGPFDPASSSSNTSLGSMAVVISRAGRNRRLWRFQDDIDEAVDLDRALEFCRALS